MAMIISLRLLEFILICLTQKTQAGNILTTNWNSFIYNYVNLADELLFGLTHYYAYNFNLHFFK